MTLMLSLLNPIRKLPSKLTFMMFALFCGAFLFLNSIVKLQLFFKKKKCTFLPPSFLHSIEAIALTKFGTETSNYDI